MLQNKTGDFLPKQPFLKYKEIMLLLSWTDCQWSEDPAVHPPHQGHCPRDDLLPLVLRVLPDQLPSMLPSLETLVTPDVLNTDNIRSSPHHPPPTLTL